MADKKKRNGRKCGPRKGRNKKNTRPKAILIDTLTHTVRREILRRMDIDGAKHHSSTELGEALEMKVPAVDYHVNLMEKRAVITLMKEEKIRGATKYLYTSLVSDNSAVSAVLAFTEEEDKEVEAERRAREVEEAETFDNGSVPKDERRGRPRPSLGECD
jgi:predicted transcriptional regulator